MNTPMNQRPPNHARPAGISACDASVTGKPAKHSLQSSPVMPALMRLLLFAAFLLGARMALAQLPPSVSLNGQTWAWSSNGTSPGYYSLSWQDQLTNQNVMATCTIASGNVSVSIPYSYYDESYNVISSSISYGGTYAYPASSFTATNDGNTLTFYTLASDGSPWPGSPITGIPAYKTPYGVLNFQGYSSTNISSNYADNNGNIFSITRDPNNPYRSPEFYFQSWASGTVIDNVFVSSSGLVLDVRPTDADGRFIPPRYGAAWGPASLIAGSSVYVLQSSTSANVWSPTKGVGYWSFDYYVGDQQGQNAVVFSDGAVLLNDSNMGLTNAIGTYTASGFSSQWQWEDVFAGDASGNLVVGNPASGRPPAVFVGGSPMYFSDSMGGYVGGGRRLSIAANGGVSYTDSTGAVRTGAFSHGVFYIAGVSVEARQVDGTAWSPSGNTVITENGDLSLLGDLNIGGDTLNIGASWSDSTKPGMTLAYGNWPMGDSGQPGNYLLSLAATNRFSWTWQAPDTNGHYTEAPLMALNSEPYPTLALTVPLLNPQGPVVLGPYHDTTVDAATGNDPNQGVLVVGAGTKTARRNALRITEDGVVLIQESGDIPMGEFSHGPRP